MFINKITIGITVLLLVIMIFVVLIIREGYSVDSTKADIEIETTESLSGPDYDISKHSIPSVTESEQQIKPTTLVASKTKKSEIASEAESLLESALSGGIEDAISFAYKFKECRENRQFILVAESHLDTIEKLEESFGPQVTASEKDQALIKASEKEDKCRIFLGRMGNAGEASHEEYIRELERLAGGGDVMARFLYAMWRPSNREGFLLGPDLIAEYEVKAAMYNLENQRDEPRLYLLALGLSYSTGEFFTPTRRAIGSSYLIALTICGFSNEVVDSQIDLNRRMAVIFQANDSVVTEREINQQASALALEFC